MERSWFDRESGRRLIPFAAAAVVGLALAALNPEPPLLNVVLAAAVFWIALCRAPTGLRPKPWPGGWSRRCARWS